MLLYTTVEKGSRKDSFKQKTLHIEGTAVASQLDDVKNKLLETLLSCHHLLVNVEDVKKLEGWLVVLLCSVHATSVLLNKRVSIEGLESGELNKDLCPKCSSCLFDNCYLQRRLPLP